MASKYDLEAVFNLIDKVTKPLDKIGANSKTVSDKIKRDFTAAQKKLDNFGKALAKWGKLALAAAGAAVSAFVGVGVKNAIALADTMAKIGTVAGNTGPPLNELQKNLTAAANAAGFTVQELADIAYIAIPSGIAAEASAEFASTVAKTAKVTGTASEQIVDGLTTVLNAYGMGAGEAARISGMMFTANKLGKTSFQDMATGMKSVIPVAAQFGVATEDVFASITALTAKGLTTKDAMKTLGDSISAVTHPSKNAAALAQRLGLDFSEAAVKSKGWAGFLEDIRKKTGGNTQILETLFGNEKIARSMGILATSGAQAFSDALSEMGTAMNTIDEQFARVTDTPAERWKKAINKIQNSGTTLGTALLPLVERVIGKVTEIADRIAAIDFSQFTGTIEKVFNAVEGFAGALIGAIKIAWQFRGVIMTIAGALALYEGALMAVLIAKKIQKAWTTAVMIAEKSLYVITGIATAAKYAFTLATHGETAALAGLTTGALANAVALKGIAIASKIAAAAQWLLNAAMNANPIGIIITIIGLLIIGLAALAMNWDKVTAAVKNNSEKVMTIISIFTGPFGFVISVVKELFNNWHRFAEALKSGDLLTAIKNLGAVLLSGVLAPVQGLLEILSHIPGLGHLAGKGAEKIAGIRNSLLGEDANITAKIKQPKVETPPVGPPDIAAYELAVGSVPGIEIPDINMPDITMPNMGGAGGRNPLHGVVDISGGAAQTPALGGVPGTRTATSAVSPAVQDNTPQALLSIDRAMQAILAVVKSIDATATAMSNALPALRTGWQEREDAEREDPRRIAPVSREERMAYSLQERRDTVGIEVSAAQGSRASITRRPRSPNVELTNSGGNR